MSKQCSICKKRPKVGNTVSHSLQHTKRKWYPNLQKVNILIKGKKVKEYVCVKCLKAGKVVKAV